jgi:hypothetical protein
MYWIADQAAANSLIKKARDVETKIKSNCIKEDATKPKENIFKREIYENTPVADIMNLDNVTIIYSKTNLNDELDQIIELYNFIPEIKNHRYTITQINMTKDGKDLVLVHCHLFY